MEFELVRRRNGIRCKVALSETQNVKKFDIFLEKKKSIKANSTLGKSHKDFVCRKFEYRKTNELNKFYVSFLINVQTPQILPQTQKLKMSYIRFWCKDSGFGTILICTFCVFTVRVKRLNIY